MVGYGNLTESFTSRVYCIPGRAVESVGGDAETSLGSQDIRHHLENAAHHPPSKSTGGGNGILTHLRSRWDIDSLSNDSTKVTLSLEFAFANPMYAALSAGVAPMVAEVMIKAFEGRVQEVMRRDPGLAGKGLEGVDK